MDQDGLAFGEAAALKHIVPDGEDRFRQCRGFRHRQSRRHRQRLNQRVVARGLAGFPGHGSRGESFNHPVAIAFPAVAQAVVQPAAAALPEFQDFGHEAVATPMRWPGRVQPMLNGCLGGIAHQDRA